MTHKKLALLLIDVARRPISCLYLKKGDATSGKNIRNRAEIIGCTQQLSERSVIIVCDWNRLLNP